jgi:beta-galactosidase
MFRLIAAGLLAGACATAAAPKIDTVLYGASYYHEYMPYERLDKDVELMQKAGITVVRVGESTWSSWEPREGVFEFAWMERVLDRMHKAGIRVILGTPTYSIPPWLYRKHPEVLVTYLGGKKAEYGLRQNMDITSPTYLFYAERVIRQEVFHFKDHPAVIGYQVDNETSSYGTAGPNVERGFVDYLKSKFKSTAELNRLWGFTYWGQLMNDWDDLPPRDGIVNPGYKLEWERYQRKLTTDFLAWQAAIVRQYKRPEQFVTQDFPGGGPLTDVDQFDIMQNLDIAAVNPYHDVQDALDGEAIGITGDVARSLKHANYLVTETNAQTIGWDSKGQFPPYDGQLRLNVYSHVATGANMVAYWHWHSLHYGQETYWKGVLSHDLEPNRVYEEVSRIGNELKKVGPRIANFQRKNEVAILFSIDSHHGLQFMPFDDRVSYETVLHQMYGALYRLNIGTDFVFAQKPDLSGYKVVVVPPLYVASDTLLRTLAEYVRGGGRLVVSFKSGFTNEYSTVRWTRMPGPLREAAGISYQEFSNLKQPLALRGDPFRLGDKNRVSVWAEMLMPETAKPLAYYDHPFFGKYPAITRNQYGKGSLTYEGTVLSDELQQRLLLAELEAAGLTGPDQKLPAPVRVKHGTFASGAAGHFYLNFSAQPQTFAYPYRAGADVISGRAAVQNASVTLGPWDVAIIEEH